MATRKFCDRCGCEVPCTTPKGSSGVSITQSEGIGRATTVFFKDLCKLCTDKLLRFVSLT